MRAMKAIEGHLAHFKWTLVRNRRVLTIIHSTGETLTVKVRPWFTPTVKMSVLLIDSDSEPYMGMTRWGGVVYLDFAKHNLTHAGVYAVWLDRVTNAQSQSGDFQCLSMARDGEWFTIVKDEIALTLLCIESGSGVEIINQRQTRSRD